MQGESLPHDTPYSFSYVVYRAPLSGRIEGGVPPHKLLRAARSASTLGSLQCKNSKQCVMRHKERKHACKGIPLDPSKLSREKIKLALWNPP